MIEVEGLNLIHAKINRILQEPLLDKNERARLVLAGISLPLQKDPVMLRLRKEKLNRILDSKLSEIRRKEMDKPTRDEPSIDDMMECIGVEKYSICPHCKSKYTIILHNHEDNPWNMEYCQVSRCPFCGKSRSEKPGQKGKIVSLKAS